MLLNSVYFCNIFNGSWTVLKDIQKRNAEKKA